MDEVQTFKLTPRIIEKVSESPELHDPIFRVIGVQKKEVLSLTREEKINKLAEMIKDFRKGELDIILDRSHVEHWISQFKPESQDVILSETIHVFNAWYFNREKVDDGLEKIVEFLCDKFYYKNEFDLFRRISFLATQEAGLSQRMLLNQLKQQILDKFNVAIRTDVSSDIFHYVYIDDGLYTGSRARKDITECLYQLPSGSRLDVFYFVSGQNGLRYAKNQLSNLSAQNGISLHIHSLNLIQNNRKCRTQTYLWPNQSLHENDTIRAFQEYLEGPGKNCENNLYRSGSWENDAGVFTSVENRNIVEKEFLLEGIKIVRNVSRTKGMYPLGYNLWPSFGFGSFCAFDMNISNTCPLVLWWGNVVKKGDRLDCWYPLLPRRHNSEIEQIEKYSYEIEDPGIPDLDQYNMCPDCGCYFGLETDGGNGFCIHCAWSH